MKHIVHSTPKCVLFVLAGLIGLAIVIALIVPGRLRAPSPEPSPSDSAISKDMPSSFVIGELIDSTLETSCDGITISSPTPNSVVTFPLTLAGTIHPDGPEDPGHWVVFEANGGPVKIVDDNNQVLAQSFISLQGDWMNTDPKPFTLTMNALDQQPGTPEGKIIFTEDNQADASEMGRPISTCEVPIKFQ